jgi:hypothetical protein
MACKATSSGGTKNGPLTSKPVVSGAQAMPELKSGEGISVEDPDGQTYFIARIIDQYTCTCPAWQHSNEPPHIRTCKHLAPYRPPHAQWESAALSRHDLHMEYMVESIDSLIDNAKDMVTIGKYNEALKYLDEAEKLCDRVFDGLEFMTSDEAIRGLDNSAADSIQPLRYNILLKISATPLGAKETAKLAKCWSDAEIDRPLAEVLALEASEISKGNREVFRGTFTKLGLEPLYIAALNQELHKQNAIVRLTIPRPRKTKDRRMKFAKLSLFREGKLEAAWDWGIELY